MSDTEMTALAALANCEAVLMAGQNQNVVACGGVPPWREGAGLMPAGTALYDELQKKRNLLP